MNKLIIALSITTCIAGYATPAAAAECYSRDECRALERQERADERAEDRRYYEDSLRDAERRQAYRDEVDRINNRYDPTICQPGEDCRRTLWRSRR